MADVITRFKLETTQYDSKLRDTAKNLQTYLHTVESGGKSFTNFSQKSIEAARALGQTASGANNLKDKVKDLVGAYNDAAKAYNKLTQEQQQSDFGKALSQSLVQLQQRIKETKQEFYGLGDAAKGGGLFGDGDMMKGIMQVAGGNLVTMGAQWAASLVGDVKECIIQSAELAKQAEGVQIAFKRLGRGDILDGLREATHGTVSDLELMKAAVKFKDFKLPVEELGTMLAFAQQKAKDTGQSIDYMVDSIVTGLGRKSLMILDNLGLSAAEIKEKMKETGDMTKAVGEIIREQMSKAGDYVETAADRAAKANVELNNAMLELGNTMQDVFGFSGWDELATKIKTEVVGAIQFTIETIGEAKAAWNSFMQAIGLQDKPQKKSPSSDKIYPNGTYWESTDADGNVTASGRWLNGKRVQTGLGDVVVYGSQGGSKTKGSKGGTRKSSGVDVNAKIQEQFQTAMLKANVFASNMPLPDMKGPSEAWEAYVAAVESGFDKMDDSMSHFTKWTDDFDPYMEKLREMTKIEQQQQKAFNLSAQAASNLGAALGSLDDPGARAAGTVLSAIANIALGFGQAVAEAGSMGPWAWLAYVAAGTAALATTIQTVHSLTGYAEGGEIKGNSYSGDQIPIMANAGEIVLTKAMTRTLAANLQNNGIGNMNLRTKVRGTELLVWLDNSLAQSGRGELVTWGQ